MQVLAKSFYNSSFSYLLPGPHLPSAHPSFFPSTEYLLSENYWQAM